MGEVGHEHGAGGSDEFFGDVAVFPRDAAEQFGGGGRRDGHAAVAAFDEAAAGPELGGVDAFDAQPAEAEHAADDIDDGVDGADFVEVDFVDGGAVDFGFGFRQTQVKPFGRLP